MKLNVVEPHAGMLHIALGISEQRSNEISHKLDALIKLRVYKGYAELLAEIAEVCNTNEELVYAITNSYNFLVAKGLLKIKM
jgi:hypothetical protein